MTQPIRYKAPPTLARFMRSNARVRCVVGPLGSGKSSACSMEILRRAAEQAPGVDKVRRTRCVVIRNTYRELDDTTRKTFESWIPPEIGKWDEKDFTFTIDTPLADGTRIHCEVLFRALDRPQDVRKLLSLELTFAWINEARQIPKAILDQLGGRINRYPAQKDGGASWVGIWMDTNPWHVQHWGYRLFSKERPLGYELFEQPDGLGPDAENLEGLPKGYYTDQQAGKDTEWIDEYLRGKYPASDKGSIYGGLVAAMEARGALRPFEHPTSSLFTAWDLGRADSTAIWVFMLRPGGGVDVVDHYENHGQRLSHYTATLDEWTRTKGYTYAKHWLPHDARAKTLAAPDSVVAQLAAHYGVAAVGIAPEAHVDDGIAAVRALLERDIRIHPRCDVASVPGLPSGLECLRSYKYEWNETLQTFSRTPRHDWASHSADAFRYLALSAQAARAMLPPEEPPREPPRGPRTAEEWKRFAPARVRQERIG